MKKLKETKNESGQVLVLAALLMTVLMGFAALAVDIGMTTVVKSKLQNTADAAALAGANDLSSASTAIDTALRYTSQNGLKAIENGIKKDGDTVTVTTPYKGDKTKIEVVCKSTIKYTFARVLGFTETEISARAVSQKISKWDGEVLPFINTNNSFFNKGTKIEAWEKVDSGYFECIENFTIENNESPYDKLYFDVDLNQGLQVKNGTVANKKQELGYYYETHKSSLVPKPYVYIFSFSPKAIAERKVTLMNGDVKNINNLKNKSDFVSLSSMVLVKCTFDDYDEKDKTLYLTSVDTYDLGNDDPNNPFADYPTDYVNPAGNSSSKLLE